MSQGRQAGDMNGQQRRIENEIAEAPRLRTIARSMQLPVVDF